LIESIILALGVLGIWFVAYRIRHTQQIITREDSQMVDKSRKQPVAPRVVRPEIQEPIQRAFTCPECGEEELQFNETSGLFICSRCMRKFALIETE